MVPAPQVGNMHREEPFRPDMPQSIPQDIAQIIRDCWAPDPGSRPTFVSIQARISSCVKPEPSRRGARQSLDIRKGNVLSKVFPQHIVEALASGQKVGLPFAWRHGALT